MSNVLDKRLAKIEEVARGGINDEVDRCLEKMGTTRAAMMEKHGTLWAFKKWLDAQPADKPLVV